MDAWLPFRTSSANPTRANPKTGQKIRQAAGVAPIPGILIGFFITQEMGLGTRKEEKETNLPLVFLPILSI